jgi:hypothetical protein
MPDFGRRMHDMQAVPLERTVCYLFFHLLKVL